MCQALCADAPGLDEAADALLQHVTTFHAWHKPREIMAQGNRRIGGEMERSLNRSSEHCAAAVGSCRAPEVQIIGQATECIEVSLFSKDSEEYFARTARLGNPKDPDG